MEVEVEPLKVPKIVEKKICTGVFVLVPRRAIFLGVIDTKKGRKRHLRRSVKHWLLPKIGQGQKKIRQTRQC